MLEIEHILKSCGFVANRPIALTNTPIFAGNIRIEHWSIALELRFTEGKYDYPKAYIAEWPFNEQLRAAFGSRHIDASGRVCYVDECRSWWDSSKAPPLVVGVLDLIKSLLEENLNGVPSEAAISRDFSGYWDGDDRLYVGAVTSNGALLRLVLEKIVTHREWLIPEGEKHWLETSPNSDGTLWAVVHCKRPLASIPNSCWPPKTLKELLSWLVNNQRELLPRLVEVLRSRFLKKGKKNQKGYGKKVGVVFTWPNDDGIETLGLGIRFTVPELAAQAIAHGRLKQAVTILAGSREPIKRYSLSRADAKYILTRNTPKTEVLLKNKKVVLIGAGTIGGYLSKLLCSSGAGYGPKGELHIVDPDKFSIENIGRHLLGAESLEHSKAKALASLLRMSFPHLTFFSHPYSITKKWDLFTNECIIVDATGSQTASISITDFLSENDLSPTVIHGWVHGHGDALVAFVNDRSVGKSACYRCLWKIENDEYKPRYPLSRNTDEAAPVFGGCHTSYHPYASSVSMSAAIHTMGIITDHLNDIVNETLRFSILRKDRCENRKNTSPSISKDCPICTR